MRLFNFTKKLNLQGYYTQILSLLNTIESLDSFLNQIRKPKLSDKELIVLNLTAEVADINSELNFFRQLPSQVQYKIERSVYFLIV